MHKKILIQALLLSLTATALATMAKADPGTITSTQTLPGTVDLTLEGTTDWAHYGAGGSNTTTSALYDHKNPSFVISDTSIVDTGTKNSASGYPTTFSWTIGSPDAINTGTTAFEFDDTGSGPNSGVVGSGLSFTAFFSVAGTGTLNVYADTFDEVGKLTVTDSDTNFSTALESGGPAEFFVPFTVTAGDTLTASFTADSIYNPTTLGGNVGLAAADIGTFTPTETNVPEPGTVSLLLLGVGGMFLIQRRLAKSRLS